MVDPTHQRKGIGAKLLSTVLSESDVYNCPTFLTSSAEAYSLYKNMGFEGLGEFIIDNEAWAKEILKIEQNIGIEYDKGLETYCKGLFEVETCMVRWAR
jgi:GNAT superfamily N-acetyltransferase